MTQRRWNVGELAQLIGIALDIVLEALESGANGCQVTGHLYWVADAGLLDHCRDHERGKNRQQADGDDGLDQRKSTAFVRRDSWRHSPPCVKARERTAVTVPGAGPFH